MKCVLVTGVLGFIFSNFMRRAPERAADYRFVGVDNAAKRHNLKNLAPEDKLYLADIADPHMMDVIFALEKPDIVIGGAAESFVDDSITNILPFLRTNILGTQTLVDACLRHKARYLHISTDEVYGQQLTREALPWTEDVPMAPRNPYAVTKAAAELVVKAAHETHGLVYQITRSCNIYGPRQKRENLVPHVITQLMRGEAVHIHGTGQNFRQYLYVDDAVDGILAVMDRGERNATYNLGGADVLTNMQIVAYIAGLMNARAHVEFVEDRKAHDFGYLVDSRWARLLGWSPRVPFETGMRRTIHFFAEDLGVAA